MEKTELRWKTHSHHINMLREFYYYNKYILTEQMKDSLLDAINCLEYIENMPLPELPEEG